MMAASAFTHCIQSRYNPSSKISGIISCSRHQNPRLFLSSYPQNSNLLHNSCLTSLTVFDGSDDTVVRSNTFWSTLSSKLPYLIAAELLAAVTFVAIASVVASQGKFLIDKITSDTQKTKQFKRLDDAVPPPVQLDFTKLILCIVIDILGSANEAIPLVGEVVDVLYAPIAALLLRQLFHGSNVVFLLEFAEEILPFTDILPLATICWVVETFFGRGNLARALRIGTYAPGDSASDVDNNYIDVKAEVRQSALLPSNKQEGKDSRM
jgi:hypothetical protein